MVINTSTTATTTTKDKVQNDSFSDGNLETCETTSERALFSSIPILGDGIGDITYEEPFSMEENRWNTYSHGGYSRYLEDNALIYSERGGVPEIAPLLDYPPQLIGGANEPEPTPPATQPMRSAANSPLPMPWVPQLPSLRESPPPGSDISMRDVQAAAPATFTLDNSRAEGETEPF